MQISYRDQDEVLHETVSDGPNNGVDIAIVRAGKNLVFGQDLRINEEPFHPGRFIIPPGGVFAHAIGAFEEFETRPYPEWAPEKLDFDPTERRGPYAVIDPLDAGGNAPGGYRIAPYCMSWRSHATGYAYMLRELIGVLHRSPVFYDDGVDVDLRKFALQQGWDVPFGYTYDLSEAIAWDPDCQDYLELQKFDGQHWARATRAFFALRGMHPSIEGIGRALLQHVKLSWSARDIPALWMHNDRLWTIRQWLACEDREHRRKACNRELAHVYRLVKAFEPHGELALGIEALLLSCGIPWQLNERGCPESRTTFDPPGPWEPGVPLAHTFELLLMQDAMKGVPHLSGLSRDMHEFLGPKPEWTVDINGEQYSPPDGSGPDGYALFRGDFESAGFADAQTMVDIAQGRGVEDNPLDCCHNRFWGHVVE